MQNMSREVASRALIRKHDAVHALIMVLAAPDIQVPIACTAITCKRIQCCCPCKPCFDDAERNGGLGDVLSAGVKNATLCWWYLDSCAGENLSRRLAESS